MFCLFLINNKREKLGDSGVLYIESNKEVHGKVINFFKSSVLSWLSAPPCMLILVPVDLKGEEVTIFRTPLCAFGPYNAEEGPRTTSICSTSSKDTGSTL